MKFFLCNLKKITTILSLVCLIFKVYSLKSTTASTTLTTTLTESQNSAKIKSKFNSLNQNQASSASSSKTQTNTATESTMKATTTSKTLMEAFVRMNNLMKAHTESKYKSERNQLDFMMEFENIFKRTSSPTNSGANPKDYNFSFKAKETAQAETQEKESLANTLRLNNMYSESKTSEEAVTKANSQDSPNKVPHKGLGEKEQKAPVEPGEILEGWWSIKAKELKSAKSFPPLPLPGQNVVEIKLSKRGFRENHAFSNCTDAKSVHRLDFWFRLSNIALWYASTDTDFNVLGSIDWVTVDDVVESQETRKATKLYCFETNDRPHKGWKLCTCDFEQYSKWSCRIKTILGMPLPERCDPTKKVDPNKGEKELVKIQPELIIPLPSRNCNENWKYKFNGKDWECICKEGFQQSPINLPPIADTIDSPIKPLFQYKEVGPEMELSTLDGFQRAGGNGELRNFDGHLTLYNYDFGKIVLLDGSVYQAEEITFHTPSNHRINGKTFPLEVSVIHYGMTKGDIAKQVVLNFLFEKKAGVYNQFLDDIDFMNLPNPSQRSRSINNPIYLPRILYEAHGENDDQIVTMKPFSFYTYQGSLPFPPCTERTIHYVTSTPLKIGSTAIQMFTEALKVPDQIESNGSSFDVVMNDEIPVSNRETQKLNGRPVFHYDHTKYCPVDPDKPVVKPSGHYEKMPREATNVFFVSGNKPSGIPGAFVIPNAEASE